MNKFLVLEGDGLSVENTSYYFDNEPPLPALTILTDDQLEFYRAVYEDVCKLVHKGTSLHLGHTEEAVAENFLVNYKSVWSC